MHDAGMLAELIRREQPCVALTGAGVSTESGIPDFRSAGGVWRQYDPSEVASIEGFRGDPARVWEFYGRRLGVLAGAEPNPAHRALAALEQLGLLDAVITQNVDGLHQRAGSRAVLEVHGSLETASCLACGLQQSAEEVQRLLPVPRCPACGEVLKPDVVMFGEFLQEAVLDRATALARSAGLLVVVGSSLGVYPVAGLPGETLAAGGGLAIVNRDPTPYDRRARLVVRESAGETLRVCVERLRPSLS